MNRGDLSGFWLCDLLKERMIKETSFGLIFDCQYSQEKPNNESFICDVKTSKEVIDLELFWKILILLLFCVEESKLLFILHFFGPKMDELAMRNDCCKNWLEMAKISYIGSKKPLYQPQGTGFHSHLVLFNFYVLFSRYELLHTNFNLTSEK